MAAKWKQPSPAGTTLTRVNVTFWLRVLLSITTSVASAGVYDAPSPAALTGEVVWLEDFELSWGDWYTDVGVWEIGKPTKGPNAAHGGQNVAATNLSGNYPPDTDSRLISPVLTLPTVSGNERLQLRFWQWYSYASWDAGHVQISKWDGSKWGVWTTIATPTASDTNSNWGPVAVDLTAYAGQMVQIAFYHTADSWGGSGLGWYIDDVVIRKATPAYTNPETYEFGWTDMYTDAGVWDVGRSSMVPPSPGSGGSCAGTVLNGDYPPDTDSRLIGPVLTLPAVSGDEKVQLRFWQWYSYASWDVGHVQISKWDGSKWGVWTTIATPTASDTNSNWDLVAVDLTTYAGQMVQIAFYHTADSWGGSDLGWYVDDVMIWKGIPTFINPETFEYGWGDVYTDAGVWEIGRSTVVPPSPGSGGSCGGTVLNGNYPADTDSRLILPPVVLPDSPALKLRFWQNYSYASWDAGYVQVSKWDGSKWGAWTTVATPAASGTNTPWSLVAVPLTAYAGQIVQIAFYHTADSWGGSSLGWYIDDVQITPAPETWLLSEDTGYSRTDKLTRDTTPELTFVFPQTVRGVNSDIQITNPNGLRVVPNSISGWGSSIVVARFTTALTRDGQYAVTLKGTITDGQGKAIHSGADKVLHFTLDTTPPLVTVDVNTPPTGDTTPSLTGTIDDPDAAVEVIVDASSYAARNNRDGTWTPPAQVADLDLLDGSHEVVVKATDLAGNTREVAVSPRMVIYEFPLEVNPRWAMDGQWQFGVPTGQGCDVHGGPDPIGGHTGPNVIGVNPNGCYDLVIGRPYSVVAGPFDLSGYKDVGLKFWRWLNTDWPEYVRSTVEVSTDGQSWSLVWEQPQRQEITDAQWTLCEYPIPQADGQRTVYLRWSYQVVKERAYAYTGWNIDDIQLTGKPQ